MRRHYAKGGRGRRELPTEEILNHRADQICLCLDVYRRNFAVALAVAPEAEWIFGRLFLLGLLTQAQYDMALRIDGVLNKYRKMISPYTQLKSWKPETLRGVLHVKLDAKEERKMIELRKEYEKIHGIMNGCQKGTAAAFFGALENDTAPELGLIYKGLNAVIMAE